MPKPRLTFLQHLFRWRFLFVVNVLIILFLGVTFGREYFRTREIQKEINNLESEAKALFARNITLTELQTSVQTESFIEREARLKLGMKKPGEQVIVIQETQKGDKEGQAERGEDPSDPLDLVLDTTQDRPPVANATKWWYYFFNKSAFQAF